MLGRNGLAKRYNTERYNILLQRPRVFRYINNKWSILIIQYKSTLNLHLLYVNIQLYMNIMNISYYPVLFIATLSQHIHTMVTLVSHSFPAGFTWSSSLVETAYRILNMIHVIYLSMLSVNDRFWTLSIQSGRNKRKNRDVSRDDNGRHIQNPVKHLRWNFLQK